MYRRITIDVTAQRKLEAGRRQGRPQRADRSLRAAEKHKPLFVTLAELVLDRQIQRCTREDR